MSQRTKILLMLAVMASVPFGLRLWRSTLSCKMVEDSAFHSVLVHDTSGSGEMPCPTEDPTALTTSVIVLTWITFCAASVCSGSLDATSYLTTARRALGDDGWVEN